MIQRIPFRQAFLMRAGSMIRSPVMACQRQLHPSARLSMSTHSVTQPSFWAMMVPKPFRRDKGASRTAKKPKSTEWNPATFFIIIFLLIGSMSIQMIALRTEFATFIRRADAKIDLLKEVIGKIQNGEEVDVEGLLGTGDAQKEREWEEVLKEIEREDELWEESRRKKPRRGSKTGQAEIAGDNGEVKSTAENVLHHNDKPKAKSNAPRGFY